MKIIFISGATKGIGRSIALELAKIENTHLILNYSSDDKLADETLNEIQNLGGSAELMKCKIQDFDALSFLIEKWKNKNPDNYIHTVINNAGIIRDGLFMFMDSSDWQEVIDVKLKGFFNTTRLLIQDMLLKRSGRIVNIASYSGIYGLAGQVNYAAANGGLIAATKALAKEVGKRKITVNAVAPGFIETEMTQELKQSELKRTIPAQRFGKPEEVAKIVSFLASDDASYINGEVIQINGGL